MPWPCYPRKLLRECQIRHGRIYGIRYGNIPGQHDDIKSSRPINDPSDRDCTKFALEHKMITKDRRISLWPRGNRSAVVLNTGE